MTTTPEILRSLKRTTERIIGESDLIELLNSGRQLRIKFGVDCTAPDLHIGHAVNLWMMRLLQDAGHRVVFLLGDLTTQIGDPTGKSENPADPDIGTDRFECRRVSRTGVVGARYLSSRIRGSP